MTDKATVTRIPMPKQLDTLRHVDAFPDGPAKPRPMVGRDNNPRMTAALQQLKIDAPAGQWESRYSPGPRGEWSEWKAAETARMPHVAERVELRRKA